MRMQVRDERAKTAKKTTVPAETPTANGSAGDPASPAPLPVAPAASSWFVIECDLDTLKRIEELATLSSPFAGSSGPGVGILLGSYTEERLCISGFEPIGAEPAQRGVPHTGQTAEAAFAERIRFYASRSDGRSAGVVGWYRTQPEGSPEFRTDDQKVHARYFPEPWHVALIVSPNENDSADAAFFFAGSTKAAGPAFGEKPFVLDLETLRQMETEVVPGTQDNTQWGQETGGLLLGSHTANRLQARGLDPIECSHAFGPSFELTGAEFDKVEESIRQLDREGRTTGNQVVGWYQSHVRGGLEMAQTAIDLHQRFFLEPWQFAVVLRPYANGTADAAFFFRQGRTMASRKATPSSRLAKKTVKTREPKYWKSTDIPTPVDPPVPVVLPTVAAAMAPVVQVPTPELRPEPKPEPPKAEVPKPELKTAPKPDLRLETVASTAVQPANKAAEEVKPARPVLETQVPSEWLRQIEREYEQVVEHRPKSGAWKVWAVLAALVLASLGTLGFLRMRYLPQPAPMAKAAVLPVEAIARDGHVELRWDPKSIGDANKGVLDIGEAGHSIEMPLTRDALLIGSYAYPSLSDVTAFHLRITHPDGHISEGSAKYVGTAPPVERAAEVPAEPDGGAPPGGTKEPAAEAVKAEKTDPAAAQKKKDEDAKKEQEAARKSIEEAERKVREEVAAKKAAGDKAIADKAIADKAAADKAAADQAAADKAAADRATAERAAAERASAERAAAERAAAARAAAAQVQASQQLAASKPVPPPAQPAAPAPKQNPAIGGRWTLQPGSLSRSPATPSAVDISVAENGGTVSGTLEARYKAGSKSEKMNIRFSGKMTNGVARFPWVDKDGKRGEIEFVKVPNAPNMVEVVWYGSDAKQVFNEIVRKAQ